MMTSLAFTLGVVPLILATGASDKTQHSIGTGVFGGMISGTLLAIFFVPVFYLFVMRMLEKQSYKLPEQGEECPLPAMRITIQDRNAGISNIVELLAS